MADITIGTKEYKELLKDSVRMDIIDDMTDEEGYIKHDILESILGCRKDGTHTGV